MGKKTVQDGLFISLEGGEGCGKTTQINRLAAYLGTHGYSVVTTREPGGTPEAEKIRALLVQRNGGNWTPMAEILLFFAARVMHVETVIKPALAKGHIVISDRFTDSTIAYQGYAHGFDIEKIDRIRGVSIENFDTDLTFILDIDVKTGLARSNRRLASDADAVQIEDRFERLDLDFHEKLRQGFLEIAKKEPKRCRVIDAARDIDTITSQLIEITKEKINESI